MSYIIAYLLIGLCYVILNLVLWVYFFKKHEWDYVELYKYYKKGIVGALFDIIIWPVNVANVVYAFIKI